MLYHGEHGDCFIRLNGQRNITLPVNAVGKLQLYVNNVFAVHSVTLCIRPDAGEYVKKEACFECESDGYNIYSCDLVFPKDELYFFKFEVATDKGLLYSSCDRGNGRLAKDPDIDSQLIVYDRKYDAPNWLSGGVFYHIFIDRFAKGGNVIKRDDAVMIDDWDNGIPEYNDGRHKFLNNTFFGGTLFGATEKLDYLTSVGVTCVYLSPCFESYSNHKYDTGDYMKVDPMFGGDEALELFVKEAQKRGISVILDGVFNHVGDDSIYFNRFGRYGKTGACQDKNSKYYGWFTFEDYPKKYECWWGIDNLPKVRRTKEYRSFICDEVISKYMAMGIKGFRLDVVDELEGDFLDEITAAVKRCRSDGIVLGEVWEDASNKVAYGERKRYFRGSQLDSAMNYPLRNGIIDFILSGDSSLLKDTVTALLAHYPEKQLMHTMNILGTHDTERIITVLSGEDASGLSDDELAFKRIPAELKPIAAERVANAYALLAFLPGVPCIFYGDECGLEGYHDPFCRRPYPWNNNDGKLRKRFSAVNAARASEKAFTYGNFEVLDTDDKTFACIREYGDETLLLLSNGISAEQKLFGLSVPPESTVIYKKRENSVWYRIV